LNADDLRLVALAVLPASVVAGVLLVLGWRPWRRGESAVREAGWSGALAFAAAYALGHALSEVLPPFPPREATHRLFYIALGAGLVGLLDGRLRGVPRLALRAAAAALVPWWLLRTFVQRWETGETLLQVGGLALGLLVLWCGLDALAARRRGPSLPLALWAVASCTSAALVISGNATYSMFAATLAGSLGASIVAAWLAPELSLARGAAAVLSILLACISIGGVYLSDLPMASALLLGAAPLAAWVGEAPFAAHRSPLVAALIRFAAVALVAGAALAIAALNAPPPSPYS
jgi:hypothetical protein